MKTRTLLLLTVLTLSCIQAKADLAPTVMLHRGGVVKTYMYYEVQKAVDDAVDGDTIYLSEGTFRPFNVNKRILVRGTGTTTIIEGNCEIDIEGQEKLKMPVLDALCFNGNVTVKSAYKQFTIRKCRMDNLIWDTNNEFWDTKIDRCYITNRLNLPNNVKEFNAFNSKIYTLYPYDYKDGEVYFEHCNIYMICDTIQGAVFNSSALRCCKRFTDAKSLTNLIGCILNSCIYRVYDGFTAREGISWYNCSFENCVDIDSSDFTIDSAFKRQSAADGYPIGAYGGQHPFTQNPEIPGVTKHEISIDAATRTMTVKLTVDKLDK